MYKHVVRMVVLDGVRLGGSLGFTRDLEPVIWKREGWELRQIHWF